MGARVDYDGKHAVDSPTGVQQAVFWKTVDLGERPDKFKPGNTKHQAILLWQLAETYEFEGKQVRFVQSEFVNLTLAPKAKLRGFVEGMLGKSVEELLAQAKAKGAAKVSFDLDKLAGMNCMLTIKKKDEEGHTEIDSIAPLMKNLTKIELVEMPDPKWIQEFVQNLKDEATAATTDVATDVSLGDIVDSI